MSFLIITKSDVLKFALPLYDYLSQHGYAAEAKAMADLVDSCYPQDTQAFDAYQRAFQQIRETVHDLPSQYHQALDDALIILQSN
ncbi:hypothetical protein [Desulfosporosinus meridiei]|uniref:Adenylate cyclase n=1 Tax=Desulfosporosinus meridiei (strain ATCC BAA-275 / DSM 13257 / KCTC 12902 / NCIMB 13706 / S10) TaxID=768704 RepID=J7IQR5_DESMD|nr:hypothetical protein [Desulfosporosinus meridiei]AFQ44197.1 hypothetical protein Desmer_2261 [Desulfosporosinus meridiei DSM 13257]